MTMFLPFILVSILNILIIRKLFCSKTFRQHAFANGSRYQCQRASNGKKKINSTSIKHISTSLSPIIDLTQSNAILSHRSQRIIRPFRSTRKQETLCLYRTFNNTESSQPNINVINDTNNNLLNEQQQSIKLKSTLKKNQISSKRHESAQRHVLTELRLTKMLLAISLTCLSLNFPSYYLRFIFLYEHSQENSASNKTITTTTTTTTETDFAVYRDVIFHCMSYLSYSINIFIYVLFGGNFRRALKRLFSLTPSHSDHLNTTLRRKRLFNNEKQYGNITDYDSIAMTSTSLHDSLRDSSKSFKLREQSSLRRSLQKQPIFTS
ncbi:unnamed protein product [Rotaria sp. Silwood2]|nr:unnamed protein product [Rotaria sp. Silwood2]